MTDAEGRDNHSFHLASQSPSHMRAGNYRGAASRQLRMGLGNTVRMPEPSVSSTAIYQLRVVFCGVSPLVWRRLLVVSETSLAELQNILQSAFNWSGEHLHRFLIRDAAYGVPHLGGIVSGKMPESPELIGSEAVEDIGEAREMF